MGRKKTFEAAKKEIGEKYSYLELLEFNGNEGEALFLDKDYGEFSVKNYKNVLRGFKSHPVRGEHNRLEKFKKTNLKKYGVEHPSVLSEIKDKQVNTFLNKYGVENPMQHEAIKDKQQESVYKNYGVKNPLQSDKIKKEISERNFKKYGYYQITSVPEIKQLIKKNNITKYGKENVAQVSSIKDKIKKTNIEKYGSGCSLNNDDVKRKAIETWIRKYGEDHPSKSKTVRRKIRETNIKKGNWHNIDGYCLSDYLLEIELPFAYSTVQQNYKKYGYAALNMHHYNLLSRKSKVANLWLDLVENNLGRKLIRSPEYHIPNTKYHADGYDPITNTIYEFYGDFWHGYPFKDKGINNVIDTSYNTLYYRTLDRESTVLKLGYNIIYIWESDFYKLLEW